MEDDDPLNRKGATQEQITEATEIFGDFRSFLQKEDSDKEQEKETFKERGVGVDYGVEVSSSDESDDLFDDSDQDKKEAARLRREKRAAAKKEKIKKAQKKR